MLGAVGLVAIGVSGGVAAAFGFTAGESFVAGDPTGVTYSRSRCVEFLEYAPRARTCEQAATVHHFGEVVDYRLGAGLVGLVVLAAAVTIGRRRLAVFGTDHIPPRLYESVAATAFGLSGVVLTGIGIDQITLGQNGAGSALSGGIVACLAALFFGTRFVRGLPALANG